MGQRLLNYTLSILSPGINFSGPFHFQDLRCNMKDMNTLQRLKGQTIVDQALTLLTNFCFLHTYP